MRYTKNRLRINKGDATHDLFVTLMMQFGSIIEFQNKGQVQMCELNFFHLDNPFFKLREVIKYKFYFFCCIRPCAWVEHSEFNPAFAFSVSMFSVVGFNRLVSYHFVVFPFGFIHFYLSFQSFVSFISMVHYISFNRF